MAGSGAVRNSPGARVALLAGKGSLPVELARRLAEAGTLPLVMSWRSDPETFKPFARPLVRLRLLRMSRVVREMRRHGATQLIMAGLIPKKLLYILPYLLPFVLDPLGIRALTRGARDDHSLLGSIVSVLEEEGIAVLPYWQLLPEFMATEGPMSSRAPTEGELQDVSCGVDVLRVTLPCSFGQALVVSGGAVVAVEAMEGTDAMIERAGTLVRRGVVVKMMRADQDPRYDIPIIGPRTIEKMRSARLTCLAVEAHRTLIMEPQKTFSLADSYGIAVWGIEGAPLSCPSS